MVNLLRIHGPVMTKILIVEQSTISKQNRHHIKMNLAGQSNAGELVFF